MLLFLRDGKKDRKLLVNVFAILNSATYIAPYFSRYFETPAGNSVLWEGPGDGGAFFYYLLLFPVCLIGTVILVSIRIRAHKEAKQQDVENL